MRTATIPLPHEAGFAGSPISLQDRVSGSGSHLLSHTVSSIVPSAAYVLTIVFGMRTGVSRKRIATRNLYQVLDDQAAGDPLLFP